MQIGQLTQIARHFGHVRLFFDLALGDHTRRHVMKDLLEDVAQLIRGVALRAIDLEDTVVAPFPFILFVFLRMVKACENPSDRALVNVRGRCTPAKTQMGYISLPLQIAFANNEMHRQAPPHMQTAETRRHCSKPHTNTLTCGILHTLLHS